MPSSLVSRMRIRAASSFRDFFDAAHIDAQCLRHGDGTVFVLIIFQYSNQRAADGDARTVERMDKAGFAISSSVARLHSARLEIAADGNGRNFAVAVLPRQPDLDVIGFLRGKAHLAGAKGHDAVGEL